MTIRDIATEVMNMAEQKGVKDSLSPLQKIELVCVMDAFQAAAKLAPMLKNLSGAIFDMVTKLPQPAVSGTILEDPTTCQKIWNAIGSSDNELSGYGPGEEYAKLVNLLRKYVLIILKTAKPASIGKPGSESSLKPEFFGDLIIRPDHELKKTFMPAVLKVANNISSNIFTELGRSQESAAAIQEPPAAPPEEPAETADIPAAPAEELPAAPEELPAAPAEELPAAPEEHHAEPVVDPAPVSEEPAPEPETTETETETTVDPTEGFPEGTRAALKGMSVSESQLQEAIDYLNNTPGNYFMSYLATYHPVLTERAVAGLLDKYTTDGTHKNYTPAKPSGKILMPPAFKVDQSPAIWTRAVVDSLGYPFINFTCPSVLELLRGTDPVRIRDAYKRVKKMFKQFGLKKPVATLQEFAQAAYRNCVLNALVVEASELFNANPNSKVVAQVINPYSKNLSTKGSLLVPVSFLTAFYGILSPVAASRQYAALSGKTEEEYRNDLASTGMPPVYILNPRKNQFRRGPKGSLLHRLFSDKSAPVLVRARVGTHDGGFLIPERDADKLLTE